MTAMQAAVTHLGVPAPSVLMALSLAEAAVAWANAGWLVFPVIPRGKTPYKSGEFCGITGKHDCGFHCATTDIERIAAWWASHPDSNIGITHPDAVVTDEDKLGTITEAGIVLPRCPWAMTGRREGGRHFFFRAPADWAGLEGDNVKVTYRIDHVEVKGFGKGYVIAAPSIHASGAQYTLRAGGYMPEIPRAALDQLVDVAHTTPASITIMPGGYTLPDRVLAGGRYKAILSYTAHLYNRRFKPAEMWPLVLTQLAPRFTEQVSERELRERFDRAVADMPKNLKEPQHHEAADVGPLDDAPLTEFASEPVRWLWNAWLPRGVVTLMDGNPGVSKSTLVADLVARITTGRDWPDQSPGDGRCGRAMWITTEDDPGRVLRPRIEAAGGDASLVRFVKGEVVFPSGKDAFTDLVVRRAADAEGLALVILDPLFSHIDATVRTIADAEMRKGVMNPLTEAAEAADVSILVVRHFSKDVQASAINRGAGSLGGIVGAARALWTVITDPEDESGEAKVVGVSKLNYARTHKALRYHVVDRVPPGWATGTVAGIEWLGEATTSIEAMLNAGPRSAEATRALEEILTDGPVAAAVAEARMRSRGFGAAAIKGAKGRLGVQSVKSSMTGGWTWELPKPEGVGSPDPLEGVEEDGASPSTSSEDHAGAHARTREEPSSSTSSTSSTSWKGSKGSKKSPPPRAREAVTVDCLAYTEHQLQHRRGPDGWFCPTCSPEEGDA